MQLQSMEHLEYPLQRTGRKVCSYPIKLATIGPTQPRTGPHKHEGDKAKKLLSFTRPQLEMRCRVLHLGPLIGIESRRLGVGRGSVFIL